MRATVTKLLHQPSWLKTTSHHELETKLYPLEKYFKNFESETQASGNRQIAQYAISLLNDAKQQLKERDVQRAWALFHQAELEQCKLLNDEEITGCASKALFVDAPNLEEGAKQNVRALIGSDSGNGNWKLKEPIERKKVIEAKRIVQSNFIERFIATEVVLHQTTILASVSLVISLIVIIALPLIPGTISVGNSLFWFTIGLFGAIGGAISGLLGMKQTYTLKGDTLERVFNKWLVVDKPVIGFSAAIIIAVFIVGGLFQIADIDANNYLIFGMAFISGFSERLVTSAVEQRLR